MCKVTNDMLEKNVFEKKSAASYLQSFVSRIFLPFIFLSSFLNVIYVFGERIYSYVFFKICKSLPFWIVVDNLLDCMIQIMKFSGVL